MFFKTKRAGIHSIFSILTNNYGACDVMTSAQVCQIWFWFCRVFFRSTRNRDQNWIQSTCVKQLDNVTGTSFDNCDRFLRQLSRSLMQSYIKIWKRVTDFSSNLPKPVCEKVWKNRASRAETRAVRFLLRFKFGKEFVRRVNHVYLTVLSRNTSVAHFTWIFNGSAVMPYRELWRKLAVFLLFVIYHDTAAGAKLCFPPIFHNRKVLLFFATSRLLNSAKTKRLVRARFAFKLVLSVPNPCRLECGAVVGQFRIWRKPVSRCASTLHRHIPSSQTFQPFAQLP